MLCCLLLWGCFGAPSINVTGTWVGTMEWTSGPAMGFTQPISFILVHENRAVSGTVTLPSPGGTTFDIPVVQGSTRNVNISLVASGTNPLVPGNPVVEFRVNGEFEQSAMTGDGTQQVGNSVYTFDWQAALASEPVTTTGF